MVARTDAAQASLMAQLKARRVKKTYLALVHGNVVGGGRADRGADRARPEAPDADGGRPRRPAVDDRLPRPRAVRGLDAARARPRHRPDPPDPRPPRGDRPPGRGRSGLRHGHVAARARRASTGCSCTPGGSSSPRRRTGTLIRAEAPLPPELEAVLATARCARSCRDDRRRPRRRPSGDDRRRARARCSSSSRGRQRRRQGHDHRRAARSTPRPGATTTS